MTLINLNKFLHTFEGSKDNISAIVVKLPGAKISTADNQFRSPAERNEKSSTAKYDDENMGEMGSPPDRDL
jgi:hypothetical protein